MMDTAIDFVEFKFKLNSLIFSNYKNIATGKALIGIISHGTELLLTDIY